MKFVNLTPHTIRIYHKGRVQLEIPPSGTVLRIVETTEETEPLPHEEFTVPTVRRRVKIPILPESRPDTIYLVSYPLLEAVSSYRTDMMAPDTSEDSAVWDNHDRIIGVTRLIRV